LENKRNQFSLSRRLGEIGEIGFVGKKREERGKGGREEKKEGKGERERKEREGKGGGRGRERERKRTLEVWNLSNEPRIFKVVLCRSTLSASQGDGKRKSLQMVSPAERFPAQMGSRSSTPLSGEAASTRARAAAASRAAKRPSGQCRSCRPVPCSPSPTGDKGPGGSQVCVSKNRANVLTEVINRSQTSTLNVNALTRGGGASRHLGIDEK